MGEFGTKYKDLWKSHKTLLNHRFIKPVVVRTEIVPDYKLERQSVYRFSDKPTFEELINGHFLMSLTISYDPSKWEPSPYITKHLSPKGMLYLEDWLNHYCRNFSDANYVLNYVTNHLVQVHLKSMKDRKVEIILES